MTCMYNFTNYYFYIKHMCISLRDTDKHANIQNDDLSLIAYLNLNRENTSRAKRKDAEREHLLDFIIYLGTSRDNHTVYLHRIR